jgi:hypothetical protein
MKTPMRKLILTIALLSGQLVYSTISHSEFNLAINEMRDLYENQIRGDGKTFVVKDNWRVSEEQASIKNYRGKVTLTISGGLAKKPTMTIDAFRLILCHEMGHYFGGLPKKGPYDWATNEGQSDYYSTAKCFKRLVPNKEERLPRVKAAALVVTRHLAESIGLNPEEITLEKKSTKQVQQTSPLHPDPQCRLDTLIAGELCDVDPYSEFSKTDVDSGACLHRSIDENERAGARPRCWYRPKRLGELCHVIGTYPGSNSEFSIITTWIKEYRDDHTAKIESMLGATYPEKRLALRVSVDDKESSYTNGNEVVIRKLDKKNAILSLSDDQFSYLKENSLMRVDWDSMKLDRNDEGNIVFKMTCKEL